jgi:hypothetical protein
MKKKSLEATSLKWNIYYGGENLKYYLTPSAADFLTGGRRSEPILLDHSLYIRGRAAGAVYLIFSCLWICQTLGFSIPKMWLQRLSCPTLINKMYINSLS